jgi:FkbM family methyltransferase
MKKLLLRVIYVARLVLTRLGLERNPLVGRAYRVIFNAAAPDLSAPLDFRGVSLEVDPEDRSYVMGIVGGYYESMELDIFERLVGDCSVMFDLGANIGMYSVIGCRKAAQLRSYAFEPVSENQAILKRNAERNGVAERVLVQPVAVSSGTGKARIHIGDSGNHSLVNPQGGDSREIETVSLDDFVASHGIMPEVLKIDVEGNEAAVIDGATALLASTPPTTFMEYTPAAQRDLDGLIGRLSSTFQVCFEVDDVERKVRELRPEELDRNRACNLVLTSDQRHAETIRSFIRG